jgi:Kef-type K+ transport system membrane component KefB
MAVPFGISAGLAKLLYDIETDGSVQFSTFFLFVGTTMAVTSLSVLSRVLAELRLLSTTLGSVAIAAGACNDTIGVSRANRPVVAPSSSRCAVHLARPGFCACRRRKADQRALSGAPCRVLSQRGADPSQLLVGLALALVLWFAVRPLVFLWIRHSTFDLHGPTHGPENRVPTGMLVFVLVGSLASSCECCHFERQGPH